MCNESGLLSLTPVHCSWSQLAVSVQVSENLHYTVSVQHPSTEKQGILKVDRGPRKHIFILSSKPNASVL